MNKAADIQSESDVPEQAPAAWLLRHGYDQLSPLLGSFATLTQVLDQTESFSGEKRQKAIQKVKKQIDEFQPSVTMIGQIKAGKTTLVNSMTGNPGLLPADVNPWTSVVTTLHMNSRTAPARSKAHFEFFDQEEWDYLVNTGGRLGELADRAGHSGEMDVIRAQVEQMREKAKDRLGKKFEALLGQSHRYGYYDKQLIERYVCLGDDYFEDDEELNQGLFADITKSAEVFLDRPDLPGPLTIRDTPGVNDTFMMREQITIKSIRESELCVVVLSAHQALTTMDLALIRMISSVDRRQVIIFVNRIDELQNPKQQIPEIEKSIRQTLTENGAPGDCDIIFGSAYWAENALKGDLNGISGASRDALLNWAEASAADTQQDPLRFAWQLSGVEQLFSSIALKIKEGDGQTKLAKASSSAISLLNTMRAEINAIPKLDKSMLEGKVNKRQLKKSFDSVGNESLKELQGQMTNLITSLEDRARRAHDTFVKRATDNLIKHIQNYGEDEPWQYNASALRVMLRSAFLQFATSSEKAAKGIFEEAAAEIQNIYTKDLGVDIQGFQIMPATPPKVAPPVSLGKTIALDLESNWWKSWWQKRRGLNAFAKEYEHLISQEVASMINDMQAKHAEIVRDATLAALADFIQDQKRGLISLIEDGKQMQPISSADHFDIDPESANSALERALNSISELKVA